MARLLEDGAPPGGHQLTQLQQEVAQGQTEMSIPGRVSDMCKGLWEGNLEVSRG